MQRLIRSVRNCWIWQTLSNLLFDENSHTNINLIYWVQADLQSGLNQVNKYIRTPLSDNGDSEWKNNMLPWRLRGTRLTRVKRMPRRRHGKESLTSVPSANQRSFSWLPSKGYGVARWMTHSIAGKKWAGSSNKSLMRTISPPGCSPHSYIVSCTRHEPRRNIRSRL